MALLFSLVGGGQAQLAWGFPVPPNSRFSGNEDVILGACSRAWPQIMELCWWSALQGLKLADLDPCSSGGIELNGLATNTLLPGHT